MNVPLRATITGASGRMGQLLLKAILSSTDWLLTAALDKPDSQWIGKSVSDLVGQKSDVIISSAISKALKTTDVLIDFTQPLATLSYLEATQACGIPMVIGTTGFSETQKQHIEHIAQDIGIILSPNFSVGVNLMLKLLSVAARVLGNDYDVEIIEAHHRHKVDAPSGTALKMGQVIAEAWQRNLNECAVYNRHGIHKGQTSQAIGFSSLRAGETVGEHTVWFADETERIEITHKANNREPFVKGALQAARWIVGRGAAGLYTMQDVINEPGLISRTCHVIDYCLFCAC